MDMRTRLDPPLPPISPMLRRRARRDPAVRPRNHAALTAPLIAVALAAFGFTACGNDDTDTPGTTTSNPGTTTGGDLDLDGRSFLSEEITDGGEPKVLVSGTQIRLAFDNGSVSGSGGCNSMSGAYTLDGDVLRTEALATTEMACDDDRMAQDDWLADLLGAGPTLALDGATLTLTTDTVELVMTDREVADPDRPLVGTVWQGTTIIDGETASNSAAVEAVELTFGSDGRVSVKSGCNSGSGSYDASSTTLSSGTLTFGPIATTKMMCADEAMAVETHVLRVLDGETDFTIEAASLTLTNGDIGLGLIAVEA